ncbi:MAG: hypothetical protein ACR2PQ_03940, partial [Myxococcota bacterium]
QGEAQAALHGRIDRLGRRPLQRTAEDGYPGLMTRYSCTILLLLTLGTACGGPLVMIPGGSLAGPVEAAPDSWAFTDAHDDVQLEARPGDPYSVNVWGVAARDSFYVAGSTDNRWAGYIIADPRVRLRVDGTVYELSATATDDPAELDAFLAAVKKKYDFEPDEEQRASSTLFRLGPR